MQEYHGVDMILLNDETVKIPQSLSRNLLVSRGTVPKTCSLQLTDASSVLLYVLIDESAESIRAGSTGVVVNIPKQKNISYLLKFSSDADATNFLNFLVSIRTGRPIDVAKASEFDQRTEESSAVQYFQFYGYLSQQQNMMQDYIRTSTYQNAILSNAIDFAGKVVLDVGAGSGILSFFAAQAGARKVYAVEASSMAQHAQTLVDRNNCSDRIQVVAGKIEDIRLPEQVDIIISEPMGYMLYNERMLETYLHAKKWLKPNGKMFPTTGDLYVTPFTDEALYMEQVGKANFWYQQSFYGVDLTTLRGAALEEYFKQPIVDSFDIRICLSKPIKYSVNFLTAHENDLHKIHIPISFELKTTAIVHGLAFWFDVSFQGTNSQIWLSTAPTQPLTHWYQVRCLLLKPLTVSRGQILHGHVTLHSNRKQSYDVEIQVQVEGTNLSSTNILDLKNPYFRYPSQPLQVPPGQHHESPTEQYWNSLPTEQSIPNLGNVQPVPNASINNNSNNNNNSNQYINDYDGNRMNPMTTNFQTGNYQSTTASMTSNCHTFDQLTAQMANGFISFANPTMNINHTNPSNSTS